MSDLSSKKCVPCEVGGEPMSEEERDMYLKDLPEWKLSEDQKKISRQFKFKDFKEAMVFVNKVADLAEGEGHHPDISIVYNKVTIELTTHAVGGLSLNDPIMAAKIDKI
jgi:4a-hydroxytetrahydrobiopterin dehydratase